LQNLNIIDGLESNNEIILQGREDVKRMLSDYQGALKDFNKAIFLEPNNAFILQSRETVKKMLGTFMRLLFLNQTMHSLCKTAEMSNRS
jgi:tetratricopeptide (TPR) repeat protein